MKAAYINGILYTGSLLDTKLFFWRASIKMDEGWLPTIEHAEEHFGVFDYNPTPEVYAGGYVNCMLKVPNATATYSQG